MITKALSTLEIVDADYASVECGVDVSRSSQRFGYALLGVPLRHAELLADHGSREFLEVVQSKQGSVGCRKKRQHGLDEELALKPLDLMIVVHHLQRQRCAFYAVGPRTLPPVAAAAVAHRGDEPCFRVRYDRIGREKRKECLLQQRFGVTCRDAEFPHGDVQQKVAVLSIQPLHFLRREGVSPCQRCR
jgi:hypothetical protein